MLRFHLSHHPIGLTPGQANITMSRSLHGNIVKEQAVCPQPVPGLRWLGKEEKEETAAWVHDSESLHLVSVLQVTHIFHSDSNHTDNTSQRNLSVGKNLFTTWTCFSCSTNSDIDSVRNNFLTCIKGNSKGLSLPYSPFLGLEYVMGDKTILVYLKFKKWALSTKSFRECSSPGELHCLNCQICIAVWIHE